MVDLISAFHATAERHSIDVGILFEQAVQETYESILQPGDAAVDVGAHQGDHLFPMADAVGKKGRVYAFEPIGPLFTGLTEKVRKRRLKNIKLHNLALGDVSGQRSFSYFENFPAYSGLQQRPTPFGDVEGGLQEITVECRRLDEKLPWFRKISFVKMDIEGGEYRALRGAKRMLKKSRPIVVFEHGQGQSAENYNYTADDFFSLFERHDMKVFFITGKPYNREDWGVFVNCWEFIAIPNERLHVADKLPDYCQAVLEKVA